MIKRTSTSKNDRIKLIQANAQIAKLSKELELLKQQPKGESPVLANDQPAESAQPSLTAQQASEGGENKQ